MSDLTRYDAARKALAEAVRVDEVKDIRDRAEALRVYAKQAKDPELIQHAVDLKKRAEIRGGEMLTEMKERGERRSVGGSVKSKQHPDSMIPRLVDVGIDATQASRWQKLAALPKDEQEEVIERCKEAAAKSVEKKPKVVNPTSKKQRENKVSDATKEAVAKAVIDEGRTRAEVAAEFEVGEGTVSTAVAEERGRREPRVNPEELSLSAQDKLTIAIRQEQKRLQAEFELTVQAEIKKLIDELVLPTYNKMMDEYDEVIKARRGVLTSDEYRLILSCLHPDQSASHERLTEAFNVFKKHELTLRGEDEMPTTRPNIPSSYEELMKRKAEVKAQRSANRKRSTNVPQAVH